MNGEPEQNSNDEIVDNFLSKDESGREKIVLEVLKYKDSDRMDIASKYIGNSREKWSVIKRLIGGMLNVTDNS